GSFCDSGKGRGRGIFGEQRREVRTFFVDLHAGRERRIPGAERAGQRYHVCECTNHRGGGTPAVRWRKTNWEWAPGRWMGGLRVLLGNQGRVRRLLRHLAAGT